MSGPIEWCHALVFVRQDPIASGFAWYFHEGEEFFSIWFRTSWPPEHANHCLLESTLPIVAAMVVDLVEIHRNFPAPDDGKLDGTGSQPSRWRRSTPIPVAKSRSHQQRRAFW